MRRQEGNTVLDWNIMTKCAVRERLEDLDCYMIRACCCGHARYGFPQSIEVVVLRVSRHDSVDCLIGLVDRPWTMRALER